MNPEQFKLAVLSHDEFTNKQICRLFLEVNFNKEQDIRDSADLLKRNRPKFFKKLNAMMKKLT